MSDRPLIVQANSARKWIGEAAHTLELGRGLTERGWPVKLLARRGAPLAVRAREAGLDVLELEFGSRFSPGRDLHDARILARTAGASSGGALLHCHRGKDHWTAQAARSILGLRAQLVRSRHVVLPVSGGPLNRWLFRRTARVICVSEATRAGYESSGRLPTAGLTVIPSGSVDSSRFHPPTGTERTEARRELDIGPHQRVVVLVGRLQRVKGQRVFMQAAAQIAAEVEDALFLLVGGGKSQSELEGWADDHGLAHRIRLLGRRDDVPRVLRACDVGVVASLGSEGFSRAALEYMGAALPVVATRVGALPEIVIDGQTGCLIDPNAVEPLAAAMKKLLTDDRLARDMGLAGRARAEEAYSRDAWLAAHETVYRSCIEEIARRN